MPLCLLIIFVCTVHTRLPAATSLTKTSAITDSDRPNVLFISIDDLNDWIEPLGGHPQARTPHLTRLAERSVCFSKTYCPSPGCNPSRTAVMTGQAPYRSGLYSNYQDWREVITDRKTIGAYFREHDYYSAGAGKIFHYHMVDPDCWDEYWPSQQKNMPDESFPDFTKSRLITPGKATPATMNMPSFKHMYGMFDWAPQDIADQEMGDYKSVDYVLGQLRRQHDKPFFLACGIYRPHLPWYVPQKYIDGSEELYDHDVDPEEWKNLAQNPKFEDFKHELASHIPADKAPLVRTSEKLQSHHIPPFRSRDDYQEWLRNGKDNQHLIRKYWR